MKVEITKGSYKKIIDVTHWDSEELTEWAWFKVSKGFDLVCVIEVA